MDEEFKGSNEEEPTPLIRCSRTKVDRRSARHEDKTSYEGQYAMTSHARREEELENHFVETEKVPHPDLTVHRNFSVF